MEEKERYKIDKSTNYYTNTIVDTKTNAYYGNIEEHIDLLNKQNKENQQLKQQLHDLPKKIVEELKEKQPNFTENNYGFTTKQGWDMCVEILDSILKKYGGEDESK